MNIPQVNRTARTKGAVGPNAIIPRIIKASGFFPSDHAILDYGSGPKAQHAAELRELTGCSVTAYEIGDNYDPAIHNDKALEYTYSLVYASNVLNVQPDEAAMVDTLVEIHDAVTPGGHALFNYPASPRPSGLTGEQFLELVEDVFGGTHFVVNADTSAPIVLAHVPFAFD